MEVGGGGGGDVSEVAGRGAGGGQHRGVVAGGGQGRGGAGASAGEAGVDPAAPEVQGGGVRVDEGRGGAAHAVFQRVSAAVLLPDDGRDGGVHVAGGGGDGDAGGQRDDGDRVDHAGGDGEGAAVRDPGGGADGGGGRRRGGDGVGHARDHLPRLHRVPAAELLAHEEPADPSGPDGGQEVLPVVSQAHRSQGIEIGRCCSNGNRELTQENALVGRGRRFERGLRPRNRMGRFGGGRRGPFRKLSGV